MFVDTVEYTNPDLSVTKIRVRMADKRVLDFSEKPVERGYCLILAIEGVLRVFLTDNPRASKYAPEWLDSLEFKLLLEGQNVHVIYGGEWHMEAYSMYRMGNAPMAIKWLVSINRMETTISSYSLDIQKAPSHDTNQFYGKRLLAAIETFDPAQLHAFFRRCLEGYVLEDYLKNYKDRYVGSID